MKGFDSWGRCVPAEHEIKRLDWSFSKALPKSDKPVLAVGLGRSYGDSCLNDNGVLFDATGLKRFAAFDREKGTISCEAGVSLEDILNVSVPAGWFLPVTPGTKYVTVAGAVANDVHGKNHHRAGTFGRHVTEIELMRSDGRRLVLSPTKNKELFSATIGGLGLTGLIQRVDLKLRKVAGPFIDMESVKFGSLDEFFEISSASDRDFEYTVAWLDCTAGGESFGRGIFMRGNHSDKPGTASESRAKKPLFNAPINAPSFALNRYTVRAFNAAYYGKQRKKLLKSLVHYEPFFYPLDGVSNWNRIYGKRGLYQFQCVVPSVDNNKAIREVLRVVVESQMASFLTVIKEFGDIQSPGMLSFPRPGVTVCLDLANQGKSTRALLERLEGITRDAGGRMYPAKDACMSSKGFSEFYPQSKEFAEHIDPAFSSSFWRRVTGA